MGKIILSILLFINLSASATNYYVSSTGNDAAAGSLAAPWRTIDKVNAATFAAGDSILFKRGETFYGTLRINRNNIIVGAYGTGVKPVLSGLTTLTTWSLVSANIYQSEVTTAKDNVDIVLIGSTQYAAGRYPNEGYLTYQSYTSTSLTSSSLTGTPNYTGAEVVWRAVRWVTNRATITSQSGSTINYVSPGNGYTGLANFGFFLQKDSRLLDRFGEWWYDKNNDRLRLYSDVDPSTLSVQISTRDTGIVVGAYRNISIENITLKGYDTAIYAMNGSYLSIRNCNITNCGGYGVYVWNVPRTTLDGDSITYVLNNGVYIRNKDSIGSTVKNCYLRNIGWLPGMGQSGDLAYKGIFAHSDSVRIHNNEVEQIGYVGIQANGSNVRVYYNVVDSSCMVKDDGGGIYMYATNGTVVGTDREIYNNIVLNTVGVAAGTEGGTAESKGIYLDGGTMNVKVYNNTVYNSGRAGLLANNPYNVQFTDNTVYGYRYGAEWVKRGSGALMRTIRMSGNVFYSPVTTAPVFQYYSEDLSTPTPITAVADISAMGTLDSNYITAANSTPYAYKYALTYGGSNYVPTPLSLAGWRTLTGKEMSSAVFNYAAPVLMYNPSAVYLETSLDGVYKDAAGNTYTGGISLQPYTGILLARISDTPSDRLILRGRVFQNSPY